MDRAFSSHRDGKAVVAIVGAGPRGTGVLERILANVAFEGRRKGVDQVLAGA